MAITNIGIGSLYESDLLASAGYYNTTIIGSGAGPAGWVNSVVLGNSSVSRVFAASDWRSTNLCIWFKYRFR